MVRKTTFDNGFRVLTKRLAGTRAVSIGIWIDSGSRDEPPHKEGITHFLEHMFFKGTSKRSARDIAIELDILGGISNAYTTKENLCFYAKVLNKSLPKLLDIFSDILLDSIISEEELERERFVILQEIKMVEDSPEDYIHMLACEKFWDGHSLGHPICGYMETVTSIGREDIIEYRNRILRPDRVIVAAAGDIEHDELVSLLHSLSERLENNGEDRSNRSQPQNKVFREFIRKDLEQIHLCLIMPGVSLKQEERFSAYLANTILGSSMSSRLFQEVREKRGLAYAIYSFLNCYEDAGMFGVYAAVEPGNVIETFEVILDEIVNLRDKGVTERELRLAKECSIGNMYLNLDSTDSHMSRIARNEIIYGREIPPEETEKRIAGVTTYDIQNWIREICIGENLSLLMIGPGSIDKHFSTALNVLESRF